MSKEGSVVVMDKFEKTRTRQSEAGATDINQIVSRFEKTGVLPTDGREAFYADVSEMGDYRESLTQVRLAEEAFMQLPAKLRARFENDPALFLDFTSDPANREEMRELGLIEAKPEDEPKAVPPSPPEEPPARASGAPEAKASE